MSLFKITSNSAPFMLTQLFVDSGKLLKDVIGWCEERDEFEDPLFDWDSSRRETLVVLSKKADSSLLLIPSVV